MRISLSTARRMALAAQGLDGGWKLPAGKEGVAQAVERLGYVQIDTIAVVQRAHHHTLWSRRADYRGEMLHELQAVDRRVFECWAPAASYVPMRDFRFYHCRVPGYLAGHSAAFRDKHRELIDGILARIRDEGPLGSADFEGPPGPKRAGWWDWKPAKRALEVLFNLGELMVAERRKFQRLYDLPERVLPPGVDTTPADAAERARFTVRRVLRAHGVSRLRAWWLRHNEALDAAIAELIDAGEACPVEVAGLDGAPWYASTEALQAAGRRGRKKRLHVLSPFDGLVIGRGRLRALFGFDYKLECYLPAARRKWGYFCLPVVWGQQFIARIDAKADRKAGKLLVKSLIFEPDFADLDAARAPLAEKLGEFAAFNNCEQVVIERTSPAKARAALSRELKARGA